MTGLVMPAQSTLAQGNTYPWQTDAEELEYNTDARAFLKRRFAPLQNTMRVASNLIVVATYFPPTKKMIKRDDGTIYPFEFGSKTLDAARWESKVGMVVFKGPLAFQDNPMYRFGGFNPQFGDWVWFDIHYGRENTILRTSCRVMRDQDVFGPTSDPTLIY